MGLKVERQQVILYLPRDLLIISIIIQGYSLRPQKIEWLNYLGDKEELLEYASRMSNVLPTKRVKLDPINVNKYTKIPETSIIFNNCNEPSFKYSLMSFADKSLDSKGKILQKLIFKRNKSSYICYIKIQSPLY